VNKHFKEKVKLKFQRQTVMRDQRATSQTADSSNWNPILKNFYFSGSVMKRIDVI
jgi:hypothetical protein